MTKMDGSIPGDADAETLKKISRALKGLKYGEVRITVHNSKIVQIDRTEKLRVSQIALEEGGGI